MKLFAGSSHLKLAQDIADCLEQPLGNVRRFSFTDGERGIDVRESVLGEDVFVVQTGSWPVNDHLMELLIMIDAFRRAGANSITAVVPWLPYSRKDKKDHRQDPITARLVADMLQTAGVSRVLALDLHADALEGFFRVPVINIKPFDLYAQYLEQQNIDTSQLVVVAPDMGGAKRARRFAERLGAHVVILEKMRQHNSPDSEIMTMIGNVEGKKAMVIDDMTSTGGTLINTAAYLKIRGAVEVDTCVSHAVLADDAHELIANSKIDHFITTDSVPIPEEKRTFNDRMKILSLAPLVAQEIQVLMR